MKTIGYVFQIVAAILAISVSESRAQSSGWETEHGKAMRYEIVSIPGKTPNEIYREVNRWLVMYYHDPEEILKARIDGEYLRGVAYQQDFINTPDLNSADLQYSFIFEITEQEVIFTITDVMLLNYSLDETGGVARLEEYLSPARKGKRKSKETDRVLASLTEFSNTVFKSFKNSMLPAN